MIDRFCIAFAIAFLEIVEIFAVVIAGIVMVLSGLAAAFYLFVMLLEPSSLALLLTATCFSICAVGKMAANWLTADENAFDHKKDELRAARAEICHASRISDLGQGSRP